MQWVAKKHLPLFAIAIAVIVGITTFLTTDSISLDPERAPTTSCFEPRSSTMRVTLESACPAPLISLGASAISESATASGEVLELHPLLAARFEAARSTAALSGITLYITSGFRDRARQAVLFAQAIEKYGSESEAARWVLPANFSHHPDGLAIDVNYPGDPVGAKWLEENGSRFGLCRGYANEWWHFDGVIAPGDTCPVMSADARVDLG